MNIWTLANERNLYHPDLRWCLISNGIRPGDGFEAQKLLDPGGGVETTETAELGAAVRDADVIVNRHAVDVHGSIYFLKN